MAFRVLPDGRIECDTVQEALALAKEIGGSGNGGNAGTVHGGAEGEGRVTGSRVREFFGFLDANQRRFLSVLIDNPHGKTDQALRQAFGFEGNQQLGGFVSGLSKLAKKSGLSMDDVVRIENVKIGDQMAKEYKIQPVFRNVAEGLGGLK